MSDNTNFGFGRFVPGFDFLQNIAKGTSQSPQMSSLSNWVAPTLNVEELEKRISELKAVHFWLDQNSKALAATIQALEVQKMTLATLKGMNLNMAELANSLKLNTADGMQKMVDAAGGAADAMSGAAKAARGKAPESKADESKAVESKAAESKASDSKAKPTGNGSAAAGTPPVDPLQWWGALTQQFQEIAANAMKDVTQKAAMDSARNMATGGAKQAVKAATGAVKAPKRKKAARKTKAS
jgi:hypothetical protein